jgi:NTE family protein
MNPEATRHERRVAIVVGSGGIKCAAALGLAQVLAREGIRASIAIPLLFPPQQIGERLLVDGAVSNPLPVDVAIREGAEIVLAMGFEVPTRSRMRS